MFVEILMFCDLVLVI